MVVQRFKCSQHGYYRYPNRVALREEKVRQKINEYFCYGGSQKSIADGLGVDRQTIIRRIKKINDNCMNDLEIIRKFKLDWHEDSPGGGIIVLDATSIKGTRNVLYLAVDELTKDLVCRTVRSEEDETGWGLHLRRLNETSYRPKLIVSDRGPGGCLKRAVAKHCPGIPHQLDWLHELRQIKRLMRPPARNSKGTVRRRQINYPNEREQNVYDLVIKMRNARSEEEFDRLWIDLLRLYLETTNRARKVIRILRNDLRWLKARYSVGADVATSNTAEYTFSRLKHQFLNSSKGLHAHSESQTVKALDVRLAAYRAKPMDNSSDPLKRGKSTLELANAKINKNDIWQFVRPDRCQKSENVTESEPRSRTEEQVRNCY
jgi:DNA-binding Lrp family transcriptional regulator